MFSLELPGDLPITKADWDKTPPAVQAFISESHPEVVGNEYTVIKTAEKKVWQEGMVAPLKITEDILDYTDDIKDNLVLHYERRGRAPSNGEAPGTHRKAHKRPSPKARS